MQLRRVATLPRDLRLYLAISGRVTVLLRACVRVVAIVRTRHSHGSSCEGGSCQRTGASLGHCPGCTVSKGSVGGRSGSLPFFACIARETDDKRELLVSPILLSMLDLRHEYFLPTALAYIMPPKKLPASVQSEDSQYRHTLGSLTG